MKRLIISTITIVFAGGVLWSGATGAFFSDTETSTGNMFTAGEIDLKVDNESYYNGNKCTFLDVQATSSPGFYWQGNAEYPVPGSPCDTSFPLADLDEGLLFFNFNDLKPDDEGEDTISLHVQNDAWMCMNVSLTSNDDRSSTEPELGDGDVENTDDAWDGELAQNIDMFWWADDGDNVYEEGENGLIDAPMSLMDFASTTGSFTMAVADSNGNVWGTDDPILAGETAYIAKAWCFGDMTLDAVEAGQGENPSIASGIICNGENLDNTTQTDGATLDVAFEAVQARHNDEFECDEGGEDPMALITVTKTVINDNGGNNIIADFQLFLDGVVDVPLTSGVQIAVNPGSYSVAELGAAGYEATFGGDCDQDGNITLIAGDVKSCTITNDDIRPNITLIKNVINNNTGTAVATDFKMRVNGVLVPSGGSRSVNSNTNVTITEDAFAGYTATGITGTGCPANLGDVFQLNEGVAITCTITNDDN